MSTNPAEAARLQCDKHVVKMVLETAQILSTVLRGLGVEDDRLYKPTHKNHPCVKWAQDRNAFSWLVEHGDALADEYSYRYERVHKSRAVIEAADGLRRTLVLPRLGDPGFVLAMPDHLRGPDPVKAYRAYYRHKRAEGMDMTWRRRQEPAWMG